MRVCVDAYVGVVYLTSVVLHVLLPEGGQNVVAARANVRVLSAQLQRTPVRSPHRVRHCVLRMCIYMYMCTYIHVCISVHMCVYICI